MSDFYFFHEEIKRNKIKKWLDSTFLGSVVLECLNPVIFTIDDIMYTAKYTKTSKSIYCVKLYGDEDGIKPYHNFIIYKVEKFLNELKNEK